MKTGFFIVILFLLHTACDQKPIVSEVSKLDISSELLLQVKRSNPTDSLEREMEKLSKEWFINELDSDRKRKAFWLNIYNAYYQIIAKEGSLGLDTIFKEKVIPIIGDTLSFDELEHGILRAKTEYDFSVFAVDTVDYRIHFALNCGAKSCPPIAFYDPLKIDQQLEAATKLYLTLETEIDEDKKEVHVTQLMEWFAEDFGGEESIPNVLNRYLGKDLSGYAIKYTPFDWTQTLSNFKN